MFTFFIKTPFCKYIKFILIAFRKQKLKRYQILFSINQHLHVIQVKWLGGNTCGTQLVRVIDQR